MTLIYFFVNRWMGKRCGVWKTRYIVLSLIPVVSYFATILILIDGIVTLKNRVDELESSNFKK
jgi:hypothetical protein